MIFSFISMVIASYALINFKKSLIFFTVYQIFWFSTHIITIGGIGLNSNLLLPIWYMVLFYLKRKRYMNNKPKFPFTIPFILIGLSYLFSCFVAISGFIPEFNRAIMRVTSQYIYIYILWYVIDSEQDFKFIFRYVTIVMFFASIYGIFEYIVRLNSLLDYKVMLSNYTINLYDASGLRGYRLTSFFEHPLGAGMMFGLYSSFYFALLLKNNKTVVNNKFGMITALLCLPCVILSKMRTAIIFTVILMLMIFVNKKLSVKVFKRIIICMIIFLPILFIVINSNLELITNLISTDTSSEIGGSSLAMRLNQFNAIKLIIRISPVFGLGETFRDTLTVNSVTSAALGYEGIIFEQLSMHGYFGVFVTTILIFYLCVKIPLKYKSKEIAIVSIAYWLSYLVSSIPSFRLPYLYLVIFYFIKSSSKYKGRA